MGISSCRTRLKSSKQSRSRPFKTRNPKLQKTRKSKRQSRNYRRLPGVETLAAKGDYVKVFRKQVSPKKGVVTEKTEQALFVNGEAMEWDSIESITNLSEVFSVYLDGELKTKTRGIIKHTYPSFIYAHPQYVIVPSNLKPFYDILFYFRDTLYCILGGEVDIIENVQNSGLTPPPEVALGVSQETLQQ